MTSEERAINWISCNIDNKDEVYREGILYTLKRLLDQHAAEQRETCGEEVYELLILQSTSPHWPKLAKDACLNAVEKSDE